MTKKNKSRRIVVPFLVLIIAICLILIATNFTQVKGFMASITNSSFDFLAALPAPNRPTIAVTSPIKGQLLLTGSNVKIAWNLKVPKISPFLTELVNVQIVKSVGPLAQVGSVVKSGLATIKKCFTSDASEASGGNISGYTSDKNITFCDKLADKDLNEEDWLVPTLSKLPGRVNANVAGQISKSLYVSAILYHQTIDSKGNQGIKEDVRASRNDFLVANTLKIPFPENKATVRSGDVLNVTWTKSGIFTDFSNTISLSAVSTNSRDPYKNPIPLNAEGTSGTWTVEPFWKLPGLVNSNEPAKNGVPQISKTVLIKGEIPYIGADDGVTYAANRQPKLFAFSAPIKVLEDAPTMTFTASPTSVPSGGSTTLTWSSTNMVSCTDIPVYSFFGRAQSQITTVRGISGSVTVKPIKTTTYMLRCNGYDKRVHDLKVTVEVTQPVKAISITRPMKGEVVMKDSIYNITWATANFIPADNARKFNVTVWIQGGPQSQVWPAGTVYPASGKFAWKPALLAPGSLRYPQTTVVICLQDPSGGVAVSCSEQFTLKAGN